MEHQFLWLLMGGIFVIGYAAIALEHKLGVNKSGAAIVMGVLLWIILNAFEGGHAAGEALTHETQEIFSIVIFLLAAMTVVEILVHYRFFDWIQEKIMRRQISQTGLFWLLGAMAFVFSAFLDNLTTTLIMIQIGRKIYKNPDNFLLFTANTVIAANAGGAASPIGDVTTIMLWLAQKFTALQILTIGSLPAIATWIVPQFLLARQIKAHEEAEKSHPGYDIVDDDKYQPYWPIIAVGILSFTLPVIANLMGLPPFLGLLTGVGILWIFIDIKAKRGERLHHEGQITKIIQRTDIATLKFFIGILLAVGALSHVGLLKELNSLLFGNGSVIRLIIGNTVLGLTSSILDNVPLVAAAIKMFGENVSSSIWVLLALTAGTGGSILVVGSAAGVAAMGQVRELTFGYYLKKASWPALLGFSSGIAVWCIIYFLWLA